MKIRTKQIQMFNDKDHDIEVYCENCGNILKVAPGEDIPMCCNGIMSEVEEDTKLSKHFGEPTSSQLDMINSKSKKTLKQEEVFVFSAKLAGDMIIPGRYFQIQKKLLSVFKKDASTGVAFMLDHPWAGFGTPAYNYGRTFNARIRKSDVEGESWALDADHYVVRGKEKNGLSTDEIIKDIEDGTLFDTSIGFGNEGSICSICGNDYRNYSKCPHVAGHTYDVNGESKVCYIKLMPPGYLMENSGVFDGAYPTAGVLSASGETEDKNFINVVDLKKFNSEVPLYNIYSPNKNRLVTIAKKADIPRESYSLGNLNTFNTLNSKNILKEGGKETMPKVTFVDNEGNDLKSYDLTEDGKILWDSPVELVGEVEAHIEAHLGDIEEFLSADNAKESLGKDYSAEEVLKLAKEGIDFKKELVEDTLEWGVRAKGNEFKKDSWESLLNDPTRTIQAIKDFRDEFMSEAEKGIVDGKHTTFMKKENESNHQVPSEYFKI